MRPIEIRPRGVNVDLPPELVGPEAWTFAKNALFGVDATHAAPGAAATRDRPMVIASSASIFRMGPSFLF